MRPDYCPIANEPCQSMCETPCNRKELIALRKDAERYRWLVAQMMHPDADHQEEMFNRLHSINPDPANAKEVDAAIDAAMQKGQS